MPEGIKETQDLLVAGNEIAVLAVAQLKDGFQLGEDFAAVWAKIRDNADFRLKMQVAYEGIAAVPAEVKDIDLQEAMILAGVQLSYVPKYIEAIKGS